MAEPDDEAALRAKLDALKGALAKQRGARPPTQAGGGGRAGGGDSSAASGMSLGLKVASEFVSAVVVGGLIGWALDWGLRTKPLFLIVFFLLGVAAGVWNVIRATSPKGARRDGDSGLSRAGSDDKEARRSTAEARSEAARASGGAADRADDDED